jgi:hypothetical protein
MVSRVGGMVDVAIWRLRVRLARLEIERNRNETDLYVMKYKYNQNLQRPILQFVRFHVCLLLLILSCT